MIDDTVPSRELDAAVAKAMGETVIFASDAGDREWDGEAIGNSYLFFREGKALPFYSRPTTFYSSAAALDMLLWLQARGIVITDRDSTGLGTFATMVDFHLYDWPDQTDGDFDSMPVVGEPLQALALALCQVVLKVAAANIPTRATAPSP